MTNTGTVLVTGATGTVGGAVLDRLRTVDVRLRTLSRDEAKAHSLRDRGVEVVVADFLKPETLARALDGVGVVFLVTPISRDQVAQAKNVIQAAMRSGRHPRIVRLSVHQAGRDAPTRVSRQHAEIEEAVVSSELPYTLLRPQSFMQNTLLAVPTVAANGTIFGAFQAGRLGMIDARDIGEVAARVVTEEGHEGKVYTLTGPSAISFDDVAEALTDVLGKDVRYVDVPLEAAKEAMLRMGVPEWKAEALNEYAKAHSEGYSDFTTDTVEQLTGHPATSYAQFARDFEQRFRGV